MACKNAKFDNEDGWYICDVTGNRCCFVTPNSKICAATYGEGPDVKSNTEQEVKASDNESRNIGSNEII